MSAPSHVLIAEEALERLSLDAPTALAYRSVDGDDLAVIDPAGDQTAAVLISTGDEPSLDAAPADADLVMTLARTDASDRVAAYRRDASWRPIDVTVIPRRPDVFDRIRGVFESDMLRSKSVLMLGLGSGGSSVCRELVRAGVGRFILVDHDRLEPSNVCRHELGLNDVGRLKVNAMRDYVLQRNPVAEVSTHSFRLDGSTFERFLILCEADPDLIICGTDNRESRLLVNRASLLYDIVTLYGGVRRRAYAGQVLRVIPRLTPCYQCFVAGVPDLARDVEVSSASEAARVAYSDRPVTPEPGLSTDIAPVALLMAKIALVELSDRGSPAFESLRQDLVAPWYFWLNRREPGTDFETWPPLGLSQASAGVLRWYGQWLDRDESCPVCGSSAGTVSEEDVSYFRA